MNTARERASELIVFCDGVDDAGIPCLHAFTARGRLVASDLLELADQFDAERSARVALQTRCERLQAIVAKAVYEACVKATA